MTEAILRVSGVNKRFVVDGGKRTLEVLSDIRLEIAEHEFVSLVGPSGCGKTTLLKMMVGLTRCDDGEIFLRNARVQGVPRNIGFIFQEPALLPWQSVFKNVDLALEAKKMDSAERKAAVERNVELTGLADFVDYRPYQLSGGMQRRVALARGLVSKPDILFMDEPFVALDALTRAKLQADLARIVAETKTTTVLITHDVEEALFLSDRVAVMSARPGRILEVFRVDRARPREMKEFLLDPHVGRLRAGILELIEAAEQAHGVAAGQATV
jgi:ABC-type nitrate/sulfonate/bicarbonate transport system ATPase subunit